MIPVPRKQCMETQNIFSVVNSFTVLLICIDNTHWALWWSFLHWSMVFVCNIYPHHLYPFFFSLHEHNGTLLLILYFIVVFHTLHFQWFMPLCDDRFLFSSTHDGTWLELDLMSSFRMVLHLISSIFSECIHELSYWFATMVRLDLSIKNNWLLKLRKVLLSKILKCRNYCKDEWNYHIRIREYNWIDCIYTHHA